MIGLEQAEAIQINFGLKCFANGEAFEAEKAFQRAAAINPSGGVFYYLGAALLQCRRPFDAIRTLRRGWRASPNDPAAANLLALALRIVKRPGEAVFACQAGLADSPAAADGMNALFNALAEDGRLDAAAKALRRMAAISSPALFIEGALTLSAQFFAAGHPDKAAALCLGVIAAAPSDPRAYLNLLGISWSLRRYRTGEILSARALALSPGPDERRWRGRFLHAAGRMADAAAHFRQNIDAGAQTDRPLLARALRDMGDVGDGGPRGELIRLLSPAVTAPDAPPQLSVTETAALGLALLESGDAEALADLRRRFDGHPRLHAVVRTLWARKLWREGEAAAALAELAGREDDDGGFFTVRALARLRLDLEIRGLAFPPRPAALDDGPPTISIRSLADCGRFAQTTLEYLLVRIAAEKAGWRIETPDWVGHWVFELDDPAVSALRPTFGGLGEALNDYIEGIGPPPSANVDVGSPWTLRRFSPAYRERVQKWLTPRPIWRPRLEAAQNALRARGRTVAAFHLRRGDFVKLGYPITETRACLEWLDAHWRQLDDPVLYLASDEPASVRRAFADYAPITIEDLDCRWRGLEFLQDFHILANADILGASTASCFSFLAALLNQRARIFLRPNGDGRMTPFDPWRETTLSSPI